MRIVGVAFAVSLLASCASWDDEEVAACHAIEDRDTREACLRALIADDQGAQDNDGIGPPSCHPASTNPDPDRDRC
jgi:hypothetical protein